MNKLINTTKLFLISLALITMSCEKDKTSLQDIDKGNDPNFTIVTNTDAGFKGFNRKIEVFGIYIYAVPGVENTKLLHAANVMAQFLDNDEDGIIDNEAIVSAMKKNKACLFMWKNESDFNSIGFPEGTEVQDLGADETNPDFVRNNNTGSFDGSIEEIWHLINLAGHASVYPGVFGLEKGSELANAMDIARGGYFETVPSSYPKEAWYSYDDDTCEYGDCQTIEYLYWAMSSLLGAQENRLNEIANEWKLNTPALLKSKDTAIYKLLTNPEYKFPTILPDGTYKQ